MTCPIRTNLIKNSVKPRFCGRSRTLTQVRPYMVMRCVWGNGGGNGTHAVVHPPYILWLSDSFDV